MGPTHNFADMCGLHSFKIPTSNRIYTFPDSLVLLASFLKKEQSPFLFGASVCHLVTWNHPEYWVYTFTSDNNCCLFFPHLGNSSVHSPFYSCDEMPHWTLHWSFSVDLSQLIEGLNKGAKTSLTFHVKSKRNFSESVLLNHHLVLPL